MGDVSDFFPAGEVAHHRRVDLLLNSLTSFFSRSSMPPPNLTFTHELKQEIPCRFEGEEQREEGGEVWMGGSLKAFSKRRLKKQLGPVTLSQWQMEKRKMDLRHKWGST